MLIKNRMTFLSYHSYHRHVYDEMSQKVTKSSQMTKSRKIINP